MNLLLDTHVLLWWLDDPTLLSEQALTSIKDTNNEVIVSVVSAWEIAIKKALGKLEAPDNLKTKVEYLMLVTRDSRMRTYNIPILDA